MDPPAVVARRAAYRLKRSVHRFMHPGTDYEHNEHVVYGEIVFQAIFGSGALSFISVFLIRLGAPNYLVGLFTSLPALVTMLAVIPAGAFVQRRRSLVATTNWSRLIYRGVVSAFALLPLLPIGVAPIVLVAAYSLISVPSAVINVSVTTLWGQVTTPARRPRMLSVRMAVHGLVAAGFGLLAGQWLDWAPYPLNYQLLFLSAILATLASVAILSRLRLPDQEQPQVRGPRVGLREMMPLIKAAPSFRNYLLASLIFRFGLSFQGALIPILRVRTLGASDSWIGVLLTAQRLTSVVAYFVLSRVLAKQKYRRFLWLSCVGMAQYPLTSALATTPQMLIIPELLSGLTAPGQNIYLTDTLYQVSSEEHRPTFIAANSFVAQLAAFVAPLLGTALAAIVGVRTALLVGAALRLIGGLAFWRLKVGAQTEQ